MTETDLITTPVAQIEPEQENSSLPVALAAQSMLSCVKGRWEGIGYKEMAEELQNSLTRTPEGRKDELDTLLMTQIHTLNALFHHFVTAGLNSKFRTKEYLMIALRAQRQTELTIETLRLLRGGHSANLPAVALQINNLNSQTNEPQSPMDNNG